MGTLLKLFIFGVLIYLVLRWLWWQAQEPNRPAAPKSEKPQPQPYREGDVVDAKFTELPPENNSKASPP